MRPAAHFASAAPSRPASLPLLDDRGRNGTEPGRTAEQPLHVLWDVWSLRVLPDATHTQLIDAVRCFAHRRGQRLESFTACAAAGTLASSVQQLIQEAGVQLEEYTSSKPSRSCDVFLVTRMLAIALTAASHADGLPSTSKPSLLLLSDDRDLLLALALVRRSGWFEQALLVHSGSLAVDSLSPAISLTQLLHYQPRSAPIRAAQLAERQHEQATIADWQQLSHSATGSSIPGGITPPPSQPPSAASTPPSLASYRLLHTSPPSSGSSTPTSCLSPCSSSACQQAFAAIVQCCEREKIIPRESVLRKKLLDGRYAVDVEFEDFLACVVESGMAVVEGCSPQRVVWPREGQMARRFACADFFQPTQRLSAEQTQELVAFLHRARPEIERGRFGFAQWLSRHGPRFIQALPHGVLVELVQLLLNKKVLQFRKGRVSVTPTSSNGALSSSAANHSLAAGFSALSLTPPLPYGSGAASSSFTSRSAGAVESGRIVLAAKPSLMSVPHVSAPSDRAFIPASILPFSATFHAVDLLFSLCSLRRSTAPPTPHQYPSHLPLYHYEQAASPASSSAVWVSVCTVVFRAEATVAHSVAREFKSTPHQSKSAAQQEGARRALQEALWYLCFDRCLAQLKQLEHRHREGESRQQRQIMRGEEQRLTELEERHQQMTADSVRQLDRHLALLSQPPIAYTLQSQVMQNSAGARTLWQARGQVMLEGQLLPADRLRVRTWDGGELLLSSTPHVAYAAEARKTQAKALVSQQLISKMAATTAALAVQPVSRTPALPASTSHAAPALFGPSRPVARPAASANAMSHPSASWRSALAHPTSARCVPLTSSTLFDFPSYRDSQVHSSASYRADGMDRQPQRSVPAPLLSALGEYRSNRYKREADSKRGEDERAEGEGEEFIYNSL